MIKIVAIVLLAFVLAMLGMAVGILTGRRELAKGCMALGTPGDEASACRVCGQPAGSSGCAAAPEARSDGSTT